VGERIYRIWCEDGPRHDAVPESRLAALVSAGHLDIEDRIAPAGTEDWCEGWEFDGLFEPAVVHALRVHHASTIRMRRSIRGGWLTVMEYREQRDRLLLGEAGVSDTLWSCRPRPDLKRAGAQTELQRAASEGAEAERLADLSRRRRASGSEPAASNAAPQTTQGETTIDSFRRNVSRILQGDLPAWVDHTTVLSAWRASGVRYAITAACIALLADPFEPLVHAQRWLVALLGFSAIAAILLQMASSDRDRTWATRFAACMLGVLVVSLVMIVGMEVDMDRGLIAHFLPPVARLQDSLRPMIGAG
jgi:hypothetical protein